MITNRSSKRTGGAMPDLIIAALLTTTLIGTLTTFSIRSGRLMSETRRHQYAIDELSNQLETLLALDIETLDERLRTLKPSDEALAALPDAELSAEKIDDSFGQRIVLSLNWERGPLANPIRLVGWIKPNKMEPSP